MIQMNDLAVSRHFALAPQTHVFALRFGVRVRALAMAQMFAPLAFVFIPIDVRVDAVAFAQVLGPRALVLGAVRVDERALAVLLVSRVLAYVASAILESEQQKIV